MSQVSLDDWQISRCSVKRNAEHSAAIYVHFGVPEMCMLERGETLRLVDLLSPVPILELKLKAITVSQLAKTPSGISAKDGKVRIVWWL